MTIEALIEKLETAEEGSRELDAEIALQVAGWTLEKRGAERKAWWRAPGQSWASTYNNNPPQFTRSLDAALALVAAKLPSREWGVYADLENRRYDAFVADDVWDESFENITATAPTPALALCLALLKALAPPHKEADGK